MTDSLLDEDGRCRKSDLFPTECACDKHRGGEVIDMEEHPRGRKPDPDFRYEDFTVDELYIAWTMKAQYGGGQCPGCGHIIVTDSLIGLLKIVESDKDIAWVCKACIGKHNTS